MLAAWIVLVISLSATIGLWLHTRNDVREQALESFDFRTGEIKNAILSQLRGYEQALRGGVGLFAGSEDVTRKEWRSYVKNIKIEERYPGIQGLGFAKVVRPEEKKKHLKEVRSEGFPDYKIWPEGERPIYTSIIYLEPFSGRNLRAFGYDMFSEPARHAAMELARDTGSPAVSGKVRLVQETDTDIQSGFLMYLPVYKKGMPLYSVEERRNALDGFIYSPFRMKDLMKGVLGEEIPDIDLEIFDGSEISKEALLFDNDLSQTIGDDPASFANKTVRILINDHPWTLHFSALPAFKTRVDMEKPRMVLGSGISISFLLFAIAWSLASHRARAYAMNEELKAEIAERMRAEDELQKAHDKLELRVVDRTIELLKANDALKDELSERKRLESEKEKIQAKLFQSQKMELIGRLAGGVAHDFNNIMTAIIALSDLAIREVSPSSRLYGYLDKIMATSERATTLTRQLLIFSKNQPVEAKDINLNTVIENLLKILAHLLTENIKVIKSFEPDIWTVKADKGNIEQLVMNIVVNARDAMPKGGTIEITTENVKGEETPELNGREGFFVRISIADTGVGMESELKSHLFEPFFSTKDSGKGIGLGLAVVSDIIKEHKGEIRVESEPGAGTAFKVYLPALPEPAPVEEQRSFVKDLKNMRGKVLLVEDERILRKSVGLVLSKTGFTVFEAADAEEASELFDKENGDFDVVFTDVVLSGKSGVELAQELLQKKPGLKVLFASGYMDIESQWPYIKESGFKFLQKPYEISDLLLSIEQIIEKEG